MGPGPGDRGPRSEGAQPKDAPGVPLQRGPVLAPIREVLPRDGEEPASELLLPPVLEPVRDLEGPEMDSLDEILRPLPVQEGSTVSLH